MKNLAPAVVVIILTLGLIFWLAPRDPEAKLNTMSLSEASAIVKDIQSDTQFNKLEIDTVYIEKVIYKTKFVSYQGWDFKAWTDLDSLGLLKPDTVYKDTIVIIDTLELPVSDSSLIGSILEDTLFYRVYEGSDTTNNYILQWEARIKSDLSDFSIVPIIIPTSKWYDHPTAEELAKESIWCRLLKKLRLKKECTRKKT